MITIYRLDDWTAVYVDNKKQFEGHSISNGELLRLAGVEYSRVWLEGKDDEAVSTLGATFPDFIEEIPKWLEDLQEELCMK